MQATYLGPTRTATSRDEYSPFFYSHNHFSSPLVSTPHAPAPPPKKQKLQTSGRHHREHSTVHHAGSQSTGPDPTLASKEYGTCLIIGRSGTGKSTLLKNLVSNLGPRRHLYLVNVRADEASTYENLHPGGKTRVSATTLLNIPKSSPESTIFIEDIISMREKEQTQLREGINYTAHHRRCKIFCVTHTVYKTGVFSMMPLFHSIIFTSSPANAPVIRQALGLFGLEKEQVKRDTFALTRHTAEWKKIHSGDPRQIYFFFDCTALRLGYSDDNLRPGTARYLGTDDSGSGANNDDDDDANDKTGDSVDAKATRHRSLASSGSHEPSLFDCFFAGAKRNAKARGLYRILTAEESVSRHLREKDLCFEFVTRRGGDEKTTVSLVDYIDLLLHGSREPSKEQRALHAFVRARCRLPESAIANKHLRAPPFSSQTADK